MTIVGWWVEAVQSVCNDGDTSCNRWDWVPRDRRWPCRSAWYVHTRHKLFSFWRPSMFALRRFISWENVEMVGGLAGWISARPMTPGSLERSAQNLLGSDLKALNLGDVCQPQRPPDRSGLCVYILVSKIPVWIGSSGDRLAFVLTDSGGSESGAEMSGSNEQAWCRQPCKLSGKKHPFL